MNELSCQRVIGKACFKAFPGFARRAIAYRLLHLLIPPDIAKILPKQLSDPLIAPGVTVPVDAKFPPGTCIVPGCSFPAGWDPDQDPPECAKSAPLPTLAMQASGGNPSTYLAPGPSGPLPVQAPTPVPAEPVTSDITASTDDGWFDDNDAVWATVLASEDCTNNIRSGKSIPNAVCVYTTTTTYYINRSYLPFDISSIPAGKTIVSAKLLYTTYYYYGGGVSIFEGTYSDPCLCAEFREFGSVLFGSGVSVSGSNEIVINANGLTYLEGAFGGPAKLMLRESDHDVTGSAPGMSEGYRTGMYFANDDTEGNRPKLQITYK